MDRALNLPATVTRLHPLLASIAREIHERVERAVTEETMIAALSATAGAHGDELARRRAELALEKRELRRAEQELARLRARITALEPITFEIEGPGDTAYTWRLELEAPDSAA